MTDTAKPSKEAMAFAATWLGVEHENADWDVGIIGGDYIQVGNGFFSMVEDTHAGPLSPTGRRLIEDEVIVAFAELLDLYATQAVAAERKRITGEISKLHTQYSDRIDLHSAASRKYGEGAQTALRHAITVAKGEGS